MDSQFSNQRAVPLRSRSDLQVQQATYLGQPCWVLKDPVKLEYFRLLPEQFGLWELLDGKRSIEQIQTAFKANFPTQSQTQSQIQQSVLDLYQKGLAWSTRPGQASTLTDRGFDQRLRKTKQTLANVLFIRLPGFDPSHLLSAGYGLARWLFHPAALIWASVIIVYTWIFMAIHATELANRLPSLESLMSWQMTMYLWLVIGATKIIHEFGHAFACRHAKGECHEIGVAFLLFSPCLYCDVSDSWLLPNKWKRIGIGLAGVYVELLIAAFAFFIWWNATAGAVSQICFLVFVVSSVSSLLFNLNPLLRLDGYYILGDWLEIPNLRQRSDKALDNLCLKLFCGIEIEAEPLPSKTRRFFITYSLASAAYRILLTVVICGILYSALKPYRLEFLGLLAGVITAMLGISSWGKRIYTAFKNHREPIKHGRALGIAWSSMGIAALVCLFFLPIPISLKAPLVLHNVESQAVYSRVDGELSMINVRPGQRVQAGDVLMQIGNAEQQLRLSELVTSRNVQAVELKRHLALGDSQNIELTREALQSLDAEILDFQQQLQRLTITAPCDGQVVPPPLKNSSAGNSKHELERWVGTPLDLRNRSCRIEPGTQLMAIAPNGQFQAILAVSQMDFHALCIGQAVRLKLNHLPGQVFQGTIVRIATASLLSDSDFGNSGSNHGPTEISALESATQYQAIVLIDGENDLLLPGIQGKAKVTIDSQTAAEWIWRNVNSTFSFKM